MTRIGRMVYNLTGIMSNKGLVKNSRKIGDAICDTMKAADGNITSGQIKEIIEKTIGKKGASRIHIIDSVDDVKKHVLENDGCTLDEFEHFYAECLGCSAPYKYKRESILHIKPKELIAADCPPEMLDKATLADIITHETQHAMSASSGKQDFIKKFHKLPFVRKFIDKQIALQKKLGIQTIYTDLQIEGFQTPNFDKTKAKELIQSKLTTGDDKNKLFIIKNLINLYKDELRSYNVGFSTHSRYLGQKLPGEKTVFDMFENLVKALKQEKTSVRKHQIKSFFGLN